MQIADLYERLVEVARQRIRSGEMTERGLSKLCGVSQPHIHNVLKQIRALSPASADRLMGALGITLPELMWRAPGDSAAAVRIIPMVRSRIGPGLDASLSVFRGFMPFAARIVERLVNPVVAQVGPDLVMPGSLSANDLILLDQNPAVRAEPKGDGSWVVAEAAGLRVRYVRWGGTQIYLANEANVREPRQWEAVPLKGMGAEEVVLARIAWIGREV